MSPQKSLQRIMSNSVKKRKLETLLLRGYFKSKLESAAKQKEQIKKTSLEIKNPSLNIIVYY